LVTSIHGRLAVRSGQDRIGIQGWAPVPVHNNLDGTAQASDLCFLVSDDEGDGRGSSVAADMKPYVRVPTWVTGRR
jgi:hypothetical protein